MALSYADYSADGTNKQFDVTFGYLARSHVFVFVTIGDAGPELRGYKWMNPTRIKLLEAPPAGAVVRLMRMTDMAARMTDFADGQTLLAADLDVATAQSFFILQEMSDGLRLGVLNGTVLVANPGSDFITPQWIQELVNSAVVTNPVINEVREVAYRDLAEAERTAEALIWGALTAKARSDQIRDRGRTHALNLFTQERSERITAVSAVQDYTTTLVSGVFDTLTDNYMTAAVAQETFRTEAQVNYAIASFDLLLNAQYAATQAAVATIAANYVSSAGVNAAIASFNLTGNATFNGLNALVSTQASAIAGLQGSRAQYSILVEASGSTPALVQLRSGDGTSAIQQISDQHIMSVPAGGGIKTVFKATAQGVEILAPLLVKKDSGLGHFINPNAELFVWEGPQDMNPAACTVTNGTYARTKTGQEYKNGVLQPGTPITSTGRVVSGTGAFTVYTGATHVTSGNQITVAGTAHCGEDNTTWHASEGSPSSWPLSSSLQLYYRVNGGGWVALGGPELATGDGGVFWEPAPGPGATIIWARREHEGLWSPIIRTIAPGTIAPGSLVEFALEYAVTGRQLGAESDVSLSSAESN
jgi:hypothetical protein